MRRRSEHRKAITTLMSCADKYCRGGTSLSEIASILSIGDRGLSWSKNRLIEANGEDIEISRALKKVETALKSIAMGAHYSATQ